MTQQYWRKLYGRLIAFMRSNEEYKKYESLYNEHSNDDKMGVVEKHNIPRSVIWPMTFFMKKLCELIISKKKEYEKIHNINIAYISDTQIQDEAEFKLIEYMIKYKFTNKKYNIVMWPDADFINIFLMK